MALPVLLAVELASGGFYVANLSTSTACRSFRQYPCRVLSDPYATFKDQSRNTDNIQHSPFGVNNPFSKPSKQPRLQLSPTKAALHYRSAYTVTTASPK